MVCLCHDTIDADFHHVTLAAMPDHSAEDLYAYMLTHGDWSCQSARCSLAAGTVPSKSAPVVFAACPPQQPGAEALGRAARPHSRTARGTQPAGVGALAQEWPRHTAAAAAATSFNTRSVLMQRCAQKLWLQTDRPVKQPARALLQLQSCLAQLAQARHAGMLTYGDQQL